MPGHRSSLPSLLPVVALVATACLGADAGPPATPATPVTTTAPAPDAGWSPAELAFLDAMDEDLSGTGYVGSVEDDAEAFVRAGSGACELLDRGLTVDDLLVVLAVTLDLGMDASIDDVVLAAALVDAATGHLCPRHRSGVD